MKYHTCTCTCTCTPTEGAPIQKEQGCSLEKILKNPSELYIENAKLTKALQQTEANEKRAEKANRQLTEQKKALQWVISKLCGANAIA